jgi:Spy/CpxP family protein refolding chaperone
MKLTYKIIAGAAAALSLAAAGVVYAQQGNNMGMGMGMGMGMAAGPMAGGMMADADGGAMAATRLADLKTELKITATQETAWLTFENQAKQQAAAMQTMRSQMQAQMQNPQPDAAGIDFAAQRDAMIKLHDGNQAAVKDLYAVLTPEQKAVADQRLNAMGGNRGACNHLAS